MNPYDWGNSMTNANNSKVVFFHVLFDKDGLLGKSTVYYRETKEDIRIKTPDFWGEVIDRIFKDGRNKDLFYDVHGPWQCRERPGKVMFWLETDGDDVFVGEAEWHSGSYIENTKPYYAKSTGRYRFPEYIPSIILAEEMGCWILDQKEVKEFLEKVDKKLDQPEPPLTRKKRNYDNDDLPVGHRIYGHDDYFD